MTMRRMQWPELVRYLVASGLTQAEIAEKAGCAQSAVSEWFNGSTREPKASVDRALVALHQKVSRQRRRAEKGAACAT